MSKKKKSYDSDNEDHQYGTATARLKRLGQNPHFNNRKSVFELSNADMDSLIPHNSGIQSKVHIGSAEARPCN